MGLPLLIAFQELWLHLSKLQLPASHLLTLLSPVAILVFSLVSAALPELLPRSCGCLSCPTWLTQPVRGHSIMPQWAVLKWVPVCQQLKKNGLSLKQMSGKPPCFRAGTKYLQEQTVRSCLLYHIPLQGFGKIVKPILVHR